MYWIPPHQGEVAQEALEEADTEQRFPLPPPPSGKCLPPPPGGGGSVGRWYSRLIPARHVARYSRTEKGGATSMVAP
ncbi:hypothetical protein SPHINGO391_400037 [Sphingomonas aurantiaca]|uniref:Uncharacterized protein n=1 Tax=Sphingomonas aurantiaca TaxID=185949 RepID=A0A5E7YVK8_9SPHN|nr:hypothetical protein SPHINGO391_400037 [Sphingomonas aurantiaca]